MRSVVLNLAERTIKMLSFQFMRILGIETSCDETAVAVLEIKDKDKISVLSNIVSSQVKIHAKFGGVVPNLAAREHVKNIKHVFELALKTAGVNPPDSGFKKEIDPVREKSPQTTGVAPLARRSLNGIDLIAVTRGPGLGPALLVGLSFAKTLAWLYDKPIIGVNHLEGHIYSNWLKPVGEFPISNFLRLLCNRESATKSGQFPKKIFPALNLVVSGGHTELVLMKDYGKYELIGETLDDAAGEAFDKVARLLGLGYPGGPAISKIAKNGNPDKYPLPRPMLKLKNFDFSYSGLKTAVLYLIRDLHLKKLSNQIKADIASSFQKSATEVLIIKTMRAAQQYGVKSILLSGGVSANETLRTELKKNAEQNGFQYFQPLMEYTGDNAAMIALAGYFVYTKNPDAPKGGRDSEADASGRLSRPRRRSKKTDWESVEMDANLGFFSK